MYMKRRTLLTGAALTLAGCMGSGEEEPEEPDGTDDAEGATDATEDDSDEGPDINNTDEPPENDTEELQETEEKELAFVALDQNGERVSGAEVYLWGDGLDKAGYDMGDDGFISLTISRPGTYQYYTEADGYIATTPTGEFTLMEDREFILEFEQKEYTLTVQTPEPRMRVEVRESAEDDEPVAVEHSDGLRVARFSLTEGAYSVRVDGLHQWVPVDGNTSVSFE